MSPIDDELRAALKGRAQVVSPTPDPLAGIEQRAKRIQRNRIGAAVAGSVLAVALVAAVVPAVQSVTATGDDVPRVASAQPTTAPAPATSPYALDPENPWDYRGEDLELLGPGTLDTIESEFGVRHGARSVELTPLFGQLYEPSQRFTLFFLADVEMADGVHQYFWGVSETPTDAGPEFVVDEPLAEPAMALAAGLEGDEVGRLVVVADPAVDEIAYFEDKTESFRTMTALADGVGIIALTGDPDSDRYRVSVEGEEIHRAPAPDVAAPEQPDPVDEGAGAPVDTGPYGFDVAQPWRFRGASDPAELVGTADRLLAERHGEGWRGQALYAADSDAGVQLVVRLHTKQGEPPLVSTTWQRGDQAAEQTDQVVAPGQLLIQASVPIAADDESRLLVALASPEAGGIVLTGAGGNRPDGIGDPGVGLWSVTTGESGTVRLYTDGDGVEYHAEPARTS
jgi:hypothetical protein